MADKSGNECPESVSGMHNEGRSGKCSWCLRKVYPAAAMPKKISLPTRLDVEYRRKYDPDFGNRDDDV
jgi:hypothetical protein